MFDYVAGLKTRLEKEEKDQAIVDEFSESLKQSWKEYYEIVENPHFTQFFLDCEWTFVEGNFFSKKWNSC